MRSVATSKTAKRLDELAQARIRNVLHCFLVIATISAYRVDESIELGYVVVVSIASIIAAGFLYVWALAIDRGRIPASTRYRQRVVSMISDNTFITATLILGGPSTAGIWALYLWISIGYGVRYGVGYLQANVLVSIAAFAAVYYFVPFWNERPAFSFGMAVGMLIVPIYVGWLIRQLHTAVAEREEAYAAKSEFTARMSHELRTPLHAIISTADILKREGLERKAADLLEVISVSSTTLLDLINKVLDLSKFEAGDYSVVDTEINLHQVINDSITIVQPQAKAKGLDLKVNVDVNVEPSVIGAPDELKEIFVNLLGNAVKFTPDGVVSFSVQLMSEAPTEQAVLFEVQDTGPGIPKETLETVFDPYVQADTSATRQHGGSGLGTAFAREIVRAMGGEIEVESEVGSGTSFRVFLTFRKIEGNRETQSRRPLTVVLIHGSGNKSPGDRDLIDILVKLDTSVLVRSTIDSAIELISNKNLEEPVDGVLLNAGHFGENLPGAVSSLRHSRISRIFPIVAYGDETFRSVALSSGCISFVGTPFTDELIDRVLSEFASLTSGDERDSGVADQIAAQYPGREILIADDDPTNRRLLRLTLESAGQSVTEAVDGDEALFELTDRRFDLAILDMHMPGRDGVGVTKLHRAASYGADHRTQIVLLTADSTQAAKARAQEAGVDVFATKPIRPAKLLRIVLDIYSASKEPESALEAQETGACLAGPTDPVIRALTASSASTNEHAESSENFVELDAIADLLGFMTKQEQVEFFGEFHEDTQNYVRSYGAATSLEAIEKAQRDMHSLAGAAATVGAARLAEVAKELENIPSEEALRSKDSDYARLRKVCDDTLVEIQSRFM